MSTAVSSCSGRSVRRIHHPGRLDGANVIVRLSLPLNVPTPETLSSPDSVVRFVIEDTGRGIAEKDRELVFEPFMKIDDLSEGLGLGLPLSKRHIETLGGRLILDTDYHEGCRIIAELPIC